VDEIRIPTKTLHFLASISPAQMFNLRLSPGEPLRMTTVDLGHVYMVDAMVPDAVFNVEEEKIVGLDCDEVRFFCENTPTSTVHLRLFDDRVLLMAGDVYRKNLSPPDRYNILPSIHKPPRNLNISLVAYVGPKTFYEKVRAIRQRYDHAVLVTREGTLFIVGYDISTPQNYTHHVLSRSVVGRGAGAYPTEYLFDMAKHFLALSKLSLSPPPIGVYLGDTPAMSGWPLKARMKTPAGLVLEEYLAPRIVDGDNADVFEKEVLPNLKPKPTWW